MYSNTKILRQKIKTKTKTKTKTKNKNKNKSIEKRKKLDNRTIDPQREFKDEDAYEPNIHYFPAHFYAFETDQGPNIKGWLARFGPQITI